MNNFYSSYLFNFSLYGLEPSFSDNLVDISDINSYKEGLYLYLSLDNTKSIYFDILKSSLFELAFTIIELKSKDDLLFVKDKILTYYGIYQKTLNISALYFFDEDSNSIIELTSGSIEGDELLNTLSRDLKKKYDLEPHLLICEINSDDSDIGDYIY